MKAKKKAIRNRRDARLDTSLYNCAYAGVRVDIKPTPKDDPAYYCKYNLTVTLSRSRFSVQVTGNYFYLLRERLVEAIDKFNELPTHCDVSNLEMVVTVDDKWIVRELNVHESKTGWYDHGFDSYEKAMEFYKTGEYI